MSASDQAKSESLEAAVQLVVEAIRSLADSRPDIALPLARITATVAEEAKRTSRFANSLHAAVAPATIQSTRRVGRRAAGVLDPFAVYADGGVEELRSRLGDLDLDHLRDIVAEQGMDHDRLAMKWKDHGRVIDRIVDRVTARAAKGSAFRDPNVK